MKLIYNDAVADEVITEEIRADVDEAIQGFIDGTLDLGDLDAYELEEAEQ